MTLFSIRKVKDGCAVIPTNTLRTAFLPSLGTGASKLAKRSFAAVAGTRTALQGGGRPGTRGDDFVTGTPLLALVIDF